MTSLSDLSKLSGYSKATISRALSGNGYVSKETRKIILDLAKELDYTPNAIAQDLSAGTTKKYRSCPPLRQASVFWANIRRNSG
ncbi:LacI family DNA-binding transcriptional regulator [Lactococcus lactis]|uniref:LacI family DNA-binding transcriptional regulator n=1 Tax=Lactococcus lactis TaxID=1358 RepID=UPI0025A19641|nr:LacI family DNA-binding transcriptional regulator [Lactococcus lactis]MDM7655830.1 LacI family DNA-binding transcriptional regulator [Lactococcus lactis]